MSIIVCWTLSHAIAIKGLLTYLAEMWVESMTNMITWKCWHVFAEKRANNNLTEWWIITWPLILIVWPLVFEASLSESSAVFKRGKGHLERHKRQLIKDASVHTLLLVCTPTLVRYYWKLHQTETRALDRSLVKVCQKQSVWEWKDCQVWFPDFPFWVVKEKLHS